MKVARFSLMEREHRGQAQRAGTDSYRGADTDTGGRYRGQAQRAGTDSYRGADTGTGGRHRQPGPTLPYPPPKVTHCSSLETLLWSRWSEE